MTGDTPGFVTRARSVKQRARLVEPLLLVVVRAVEELDEAHVVCLRRGEWVSGAASSARATPAATGAPS